MDDPPAGLSPKHLKIWEDAIELLDRCKRRTEVSADKMLPVAASTEAVDNLGVGALEDA
jgi:hypothetical protein